MSVELEPRLAFPNPEDGDSHDAAPGSHASSHIAPPDRGAGALKFLFGCFLIEAILWGFTISFGVFQDYYSRLPQFEHDTNIAMIGTIATSFQFLASPFFTPFVIRYHSWRRTLFVTGCLVCVSAVLASSFTNSISQLIATQGFLYGLGFATAYTPMLSMMDEWFVVRRGFAYGVVFAGAGSSGVGLPFLMEWLLKTYGYKIALRIMAAGMGVGLLPALILVKGRLAPSSRSQVSYRADLGFLKNPHFWVLNVSNILQSLAYYIPFVYLPTYATQVGLSPRSGALLLAVLNIASTAGQVGFGYLTLHVSNVFILLFTTTLVSSMAAFCVWGLSHSLPPLIAFAILFGTFGGAYVVFWQKFSLVAEEPQRVYSILSFGKGLGSIATGPITKSLINQPLSVTYGLGKYQSVIIYMGTMMLASSLGVVGWPLWGGQVRKTHRE